MIVLYLIKILALWLGLHDSIVFETCMHVIEL
jgi:hypothetical protein